MLKTYSTLPACPRAMRAQATTAQPSSEVTPGEVGSASGRASEARAEDVQSSDPGDRRGY
jgi:hypothetical protein